MFCFHNLHSVFCLVYHGFVSVGEGVLSTYLLCTSRNDDLRILSSVSPMKPRQLGKTDTDFGK